MEVGVQSGFGSNTNRKEIGSNLTRSASSAGLIVPVILSGGGGTRLWPASNDDIPKQFLRLVGTRSLYQGALDRVRDRNRFLSPIVVGNLRHVDFCEADLEGDEARLILEPCARNTAPAIVMAASVVREIYGPDTLMLVMPSDHLIDDVKNFHETVAAAEPAAQSGRLVTFGVVPTAPETGYGYLRIGAELFPSVFEVSEFVEKPRADLAKAMVDGGDHFWNAGIFLFQAGVLLEQAGQVAPEIARCGEEAIRSGSAEGIRIFPDFRTLEECPNESIDYAIMEQASNVAVVRISAGWSDLGSWDALASLSGYGSAAGAVTALECEDCYIRSDGLEVAALGVRDLIIVASGQSLLVLPRGRSQEVRRLVSAMKSKAAG